MSFCFYPEHEFACANVGHCPHLGGAALSTLVMIASRSDQSWESSRLTIRGLEERNAELSSQIVSLQNQLEQVRLELKLERQNKFATNKQKQAEQVAGAKQKCLVHIARTARDWQKLTKKDSIDYAFFENVREFVSRGCKFYRLRKAGKLSDEQQASEKVWLEERLEYLSTCDVTHEKANTLQARLLRHYSEWLVFVDDPRVPPTNNLAERALRPLVVLRKITFGNRSEAGAERLATLMTVGETARRHGRRPSDIYYELLTRPPTKVLRGLYAGE